MKSILTKIKDWLVSNWELKTAFIITYLIPLYLLSGIVAFSDEVSGGQKLALGGIIAAGTLFIVIYKKIKEYIIRMKKGVVRGVLRITTTALFWSVVFGIIYGMEILSTNLYDFWIKVGVCFAIGHIFYMKDEIRKGKENKNI